MTATFTLTGRILDKAKQPIQRATLVLTATPGTISDPDTNETYTTTPPVTTDDNGYLCRKVDGEPANAPGVALIVGVQYTLRGVSNSLLPAKTFTAPAAGATIDFADIATEPGDLPASWSNEVAELLQRIVALENSGVGGGGPAYDDTDVRADFAAADLATLNQAKAYADALGVNLSALITLAEESSDIAALTAAVQALATAPPDVTQAELDAEATARTTGDTNTLNAAKSDATTKANNAQSAAISAAATDATTKAGNAQTAAISAAATDATSKASAAQSAAIAAAATDAATKANAAQAASTPIAHATDTTNPHATTKAQVGLGNVDNTSDAGKPVSTAQATALAGKGDAAGTWVDLVRAAQFGVSHTAAIASDSTSDNLAGATEHALLSLKLLAAQYPGVRMEHYQFDDPTQTYGTATVVNAGPGTTGGIVAHDTFSVAGNAVGAATDDVGTWVGSGTMTKASGVVTPSANGALSLLTPAQEATVTAKLKVTTAGFSGGSQAVRLCAAQTNAALSGFGYTALLTIVSANQTYLTLRKQTPSGGVVDMLPTSLRNLGLNSVTAQDATLALTVSGTTLSLVVTVGATVTTETVTIVPPELTAMGSYAGVGVGATVGAVTIDEATIATATIAAPTIKLYNGSVAGKNTDYVPSRVSALFPVTMDSIALSYGHNSFLTVSGFIADYATTVAAVKTAQPTARIYVMSQNPEFAPFDANKVVAHRQRQVLLRAFAATNGCRYIPVLEAFEATTSNGLPLVQGDGVHPTNPPSGNPDDGYGSTLWARTVTGIAAAGPTATVTTARRYKTGTQSVNTGATTVVGLGTVDFNRGTGLTTATADSITVSTAGVYLVTAEVNFTAGTAGARNLLIRVGSTIVREIGGVGSVIRCSGSTVLVLAAADVVSLGVYVDGGGAATISGTAPKDTGLMVTRLGD